MALDVIGKLPKLRTDIQITPALVKGRQVVAFKDMLGLMKDTIVLAPDTVTLLPFFDGEHTTRDLQIVLMRQHGNRLVMVDEIEYLINELDQLCLLQTERYREKKREQVKLFTDFDYRPAALAGSAYPDNPAELNRMIHDLLAGGEGEALAQSGRVRALIAPHIDFKIGKISYAKAYAALNNIKPSRIIVMGTGHALDEGIFSITAKDYVTPLGRFPTDTDSVRVLQANGGSLVAADDFAHRNEHSIEFQMIFLRYLFDDDIPVIPILFGSLDRFLTTVDRPSKVPEVARFIESLSSIVDESTLIVAGVDLSHVGPKFGHPHPAAYYENEFSAHDQVLLDALCAGSAATFWAEGTRVKDRYHVCGFPVLACLLEILPGLQGRVLDYQIWHEQQTHSAVSFAAAVLSTGN